MGWCGLLVPVPVATLPREALEDVRRVLRALYRARVRGGAEEPELRRWRDLGEEVVRLRRRARFGSDARLWRDARVRLRLLLGACEELPAELVPGVRALLAAAARPVVEQAEQPGETAVETTGVTPAWAGPPAGGDGEG